MISKLRSLYPEGSSRRIILMFILMNAFGFFALSGPRGFIIAFLEYEGFTAGTIGPMISMMAAFGIIGSFTIGFLCDKIGRIKPFYFVLMVMALFAAFVIYSWRPPPVIMFMAMAVMGMSLMTCVQLVDSWVLESGEAARQAYGKARGAGAFGWALGLMTLGALVSALGYSAMPFISLAFAAIAFGIARKIPDARKTKHGKAISVKSLKELFANYRYIYLLITTFLIFGMVSAEWVLNSIKAAQLGTPVTFGIFAGTMAMIEVPFYALFGRIAKRFKITHIFAFGASVYIVRIALMGLAPSIGIMTLIALTNAFAYAPCYMCTKMLIDAEVPAHLKTTGQLIAAAVFSGLAGIVFPTAIGLIAGAVGLERAFFLLAGFAVVPFVLALIFVYIKASAEATS
ncbi:MAG: MFS transporter [Defluviitaleaceae bacterium]|nr:MFS transporter [Defluviitaleaceae bacterium]